MAHLFSAYFLARNAENNGEDNVIFTGLRALGSIGNSIDYWVDVAGVFGQGEPIASGSRPSLSGFGFDVGATYHIESPLDPTITVSYAFGAGDSDLSDGTDSSFRQTGIHDNQGRFNGLAYFDYYGEVLDPELHNLGIFTVGAGLRPFPRTSIDLVYHNYKQQNPAPSVRRSTIRANPLGLDTDIGDEIDLIIAHRSTLGLGLNFAGGYFFPGNAYENADGAWVARALVWYSF
jgi:alginate production protein